MKVWRATLSPWWEVEAMRKLLAANCSRMLRNKLFWLGTVAMLVFGIYLPVSHYANMQKYTFPMHIDMGFIVFRRKDIK